MSFTYFDEHTLESLQNFLSQKAVLKAGEEITSLQNAGHGNMNATLLLQLSSRRKLIVKQSRPFVKKYPEFKAPETRILAESKFYDLIAEQLAENADMPKRTHLFEDQRMAIFEFVEDALDGGFLYEEDKRGYLGNLQEALNGVGSWLGKLHSLSVDSSELLRNREMAEFQRHQMFDVPFEMLEKRINSSEATPLERRVWDVCRSSAFLIARNGLDHRLMRETPTLLHGDFFARNWLFLPDSSIQIIDPEFCFFGPPEHDLGVMLAHMQLAGLEIPQMAAVLRSYAAHAGTYDPNLCDGYARFEILRRLLGVARLPIHSNRAEKLLNETLNFYLQ